jgi:CDP-diglyceride synthetase
MFLTVRIRNYSASGPFCGCLTAFCHLAGIVCTRLASDMPSNVWTLCSYSTTIRPQCEPFHPRHCYNLHWNVLFGLMGSFEPTRLAPLAAPFLAFLKRSAHTTLPDFIPKAIHLPITNGAIFIFWSWLSLAFSDVGAYFVGRRFGKTKLSAVSAAAGKTSPNKTVEGVIGGCLVSSLLAIFGAWVQKWPYWLVTGAIHGIVLGFLGLIGDLTASMLKRDAGLKDFGDLIPEHGGILDRVDSFVWSAPYSWLVFSTILPALRAIQ